MRVLLALASPEAADVDRALAQIQELSRTGGLKVVDLAVLSGEQNIHHFAGRAAHTAIAPVALLGAALGAALGMLISRPVVGAILGLIVAGAAKLARPHRISDRFIKSLGTRRVSEEETAIFILADDVEDPELLRRATQQTDKLLYANDSQLRELLAPS